MALEYDRFQRFGTMKLEFVYFFKSSIVLGPIDCCHTNSRICGSSIRPTVLMTFCVKVISIHIISGVGLDPIGATISNLSQVRTHRQINLPLQD
jgi:hypothetical protein